MMMAVPRSGWTITSSIGTAAITSIADEVAPGEPVDAPGHEGGEGDDQPEDRELGGLHLDRTEVDPAAGTLGVVADHEHAQQAERSTARR